MKKKKKGFTLIELLAVISILGVTALVVYPNVTKKMMESKEKALKIQEEDIKKATASWVLKNSSFVPMENGGQMTIYLSDLKRSGLIDQDLVNAKTKKKFPDDMEIIITREENKYTYSVDLKTGSIESEAIKEGPSLYLNGMSLEYTEVKQAYVDKGVVGLYSDGTSIPKNAIVMNPSTINTNSLGKHIIEYSISVAGHKTSVKRTVVVRDTTPPSLTIPTNTTIQVTTNAFDTKAGVKAIDNYEGDVTNKVTVTGNLTTRIPGVYVLTYRVTDSNGNTRVKKRTITVVNA